MKLTGGSIWQREKLQNPAIREGKRGAVTIFCVPLLTVY
jgi:hypothetical protein